MKNLMLLVCLVVFCQNGFAQSDDRLLYGYDVFTNALMPGAYYYSSVRYAGGSYLDNVKKKLPADESISHTPGSSLRLTAINARDGNWEANILIPRTRGKEVMKRGNTLRFYIYGLRDLDCPTVKLWKRDSSFSKTVRPVIAEKQNGWNRVEVSVKDFGISGEELDHLIAVTFEQSVRDGSKSDLHIDDVEFCTPRNDGFQKNGLQNIKAVGYCRHVDIFWDKLKDENIKYVKVYRSQDGEHYFPIGVQGTDINLYTDFTGAENKRYWYKLSLIGTDFSETGATRPLAAATRSMSGDELLSMVQNACFRYYWQGAEEKSGLALECVPGKRTLVAMGASGFGLMAIVVAMDRKFISHGDGVDRLQKITAYLKKAEKFHGAFAHFYRGPDYTVDPFFGSRDNGADLVETAFLMQGLIAVKSYLNKSDKKERAIADDIDSLWRGVEWSWFKQTADSKYLYWHWSPDQGWVINHPLIGWNETMIVYLLAISSPTHSVPASMYYTGFASPDSMAQKYRGWGGSPDGTHFSNGKPYFGITLPVGVSNGGPLFFTHYSYMGWDPHSLTDKYTNYFENNKAIATINYRYCLSNPNNEAGVGPGAWGFTASDGPVYYFADEPVQSREDGKITPTGAVASMPYLPRESMDALKNYYNNYGKYLWGEYGFRDAINPELNWCLDRYIGLNQAPMTVMIENYRTGLIWKLFMADKDVQNGLRKLNIETAGQKNK